MRGQRVAPQLIEHARRFGQALPSGREACLERLGRTRACLGVTGQTPQVAQVASHVGESPRLAGVDRHAPRLAARVFLHKSRGHLLWHGHRFEGF